MSAEVAARRLILIDRIVRLSPEKIADAESALDEIETDIAVGSPEALGRSLHAIIDPRPWDELSETMRGWFIHGAARLRKRWSFADHAELRRLLRRADEAAKDALAERDAAIVTLEAATEAADNYDSVSTALELLRDRANAVVTAFESSGTKWVGATIHDLRKALEVWR